MDKLGIINPTPFLFDFVFQVKSSKSGNCNSFVLKLPMEVFGSFLQRISCPLVEGLWVGEEVDVLLVQLTLSTDSLLLFLAF